MSGRGRGLEALALLAVASLPLWGDACREPVERCAQDGAVVDPDYRVVVDLGPAGARRFCGVACADRWLASSGVAARSVLVTDCVGGETVDARSAVYVETHAGRREDAPDAIRVFASPKEAARHVGAYGGEILRGDRRPLRNAVFGQPFSGRRDRGANGR
jgi:hypothetical protein